MSLPNSPLSLWLAEYGPYTHNPPLKGDVTVDVAIIGGGFPGLSTAYHLRRDNPGMKVAVLEAETIGYGASGRNGGVSLARFWGGRAAGKARGSSPAAG